MTLIPNQPMLLYECEVCVERRLYANLAKFPVTEATPVRSIPKRR